MRGWVGQYKKPPQYPTTKRKTVVLQNPSKMRGRDASLVKPMSFGVGSLAIGSAHCPHAPPGTGLVASNLVSIKAQLPPVEIHVQYEGE
ncbi:hypothetical protein An15g06300 [Aspergillus niger]|uniref:Uncharacterized protein n=2 Tax=Aspergillus niger TaxID=5061 RepID=A2R615_ASPNC|nr:hypothetical protein An15g06300 [Aspergillus niger]CAK42582.1 hypothetical protein An15g06300 [Aspergillus niger]